MHRLTLDDRRRLGLEQTPLGGVDGAFAVERATQWIDHTTEEPITDRHGKDGASLLDGVSLFDVVIVTEEDDTDVVLVDVQSHADQPFGKLEQLGGHDAGETLAAGNTVGDRSDITDRLL